MDVVCKIDWDSHTRALARSRRGRGHKATAVRSPQLMRGDRTPDSGLLPQRFARIHGQRPKSKKELRIRQDDHPRLVVLRMFATYIQVARASATLVTLAP
jgi:hypothetical protein